MLNWRKYQEAQVYNKEHKNISSLGNLFADI